MTHDPVNSGVVGGPSSTEDIDRTNDDADLFYVPPPRAASVELHPSRMTAGRSLQTIANRVVADRAAIQVASTLRHWSGRASCVLTSSGRSALLLALITAGVAPGDAVVVPTIACPAVADAVLAAGARPVFVDVDADSGPDFGTVDVSGRAIVLTNGFGREEAQRWVPDLRSRGGVPILDLAQAVPAPAVLRRYCKTDVPVVLSFGTGKALGGLGGGALLGSGIGTFLTAPNTPGGAQEWGLATLEHALLRAPLHVGAAVQRRRRRRAPGWSHTRRDHLPTAPSPVILERMSSWQAAAARVMLNSATELFFSAQSVHRFLEESLTGQLTTTRVLPAQPDLTPTLDLVTHDRQDRFRFGQVLASRGIPATWNYFPLHRTPAYLFEYDTDPVSLPRSEHLWRRVLSIPKQPQPRMDPEQVVDAVFAADRCVARGGRPGA